MKHTRTPILHTVLLSIVLFTSCDTFDFPMTDDPLVMKKDYTGVYAAIDPDEGPESIKDTLRVYMPYPGIYSLFYESMEPTDSTKTSEERMLGMGHFSNFHKDFYFNMAVENEWMYVKIDQKKNSLQTHFIKLKNDHKGLTREEVLNEIKEGRYEPDTEMIFEKVRDFGVE